jgi:hypothetical protein
MVKLIRILTKQNNKSWHLYIDHLTTVKKEYDARDTSGGTISEEEMMLMTQVSRRPTKAIATGYQGWDREYFQENSVAFIFYFDTIENAKSYYEIMSDKMNLENIPNNLSYKENYSVAWRLLDEENNTVDLAI